MRAARAGWWHWAYPRRRGGNARIWHIREAPMGLSPQARGKPFDFGDPGASHGPIPAGAGETPAEGARLRKSRAYPRRRGGNCCIPPPISPGEGLSPQARGKRCGQLGQAGRTGPIPAGAGETRCWRTANVPQGAYPRRRGGNLAVKSEFSANLGLSPQARGKRLRGNPGAGWHGPIPAGAGETLRHAVIDLANRAYPRRRGGNRFRYRFNADLGRGLSPQARGKP